MVVKSTCDGTPSLSVKLLLGCSNKLCNVTNLGETDEILIVSSNLIVNPPVCRLKLIKSAIAGEIVSLTKTSTSNRVTGSTLYPDVSIAVCSCIDR